MAAHGLSNDLHSVIRVGYTPSQGASQGSQPSAHDTSIASNTLLSAASRALSDNPDITNTSPLTAHRSMSAVPSRGQENTPPYMPTTDVWEEDSEEAKAILEFGIEDPEEEEQKALFESIPGFDDALESDDEDIAAGDAQTTWRSSRVCSNSSAESVGGEGDLDGEADGTQSDGDESASDPASSSGNGTDTEDYEGSDVSSLADADDYSTSPVFKSSHTYAYYDHMPGIKDVEATVPSSGPSRGGVFVFANADVQGSSQWDASESVHCSVEEYEEAQESEFRASMEAHERADDDHAAPVPNLRTLRRSARLKRTRQETPEYELEPPRMAKRRHTTAQTATLAGHSVAPTETNSRRRKVKGKKAVQPTRLYKATVAPPSDTTGPEDASHAQKATRSGRIPEWFLNKCIVIDKGLEKVACGINSCAVLLPRTDPRAARKHIRSHFSPAQRKASTNVCPWIDCAQTVKTGKNEDGLLRHFNEAHLKLRYECPGKCTDKNGKKRTWARTDELKRHEERNPCDYPEDAVAFFVRIVIQIGTRTPPPTSILNHLPRSTLYPYNMSASTAPCQARSPLQAVLANHPPSTPHTPPRPRTSHGSENLPLQLPTSPWDEDSEEARAIHQFGIEDYDEDEEKEVFDSIPGYDDVCVGDAPDTPRSAGSPSKVTTNPTPCGTDVLGWTHTTDDVDTDSVGSDQAVDRSQADESCSSSEPDSDSDSDSYATMETDSSDDSQPEMFSESDTVEEHPAHSSASISEEHVATEAGEDAEVDRFDEAEHCETANKSACSEAEQSSPETDSDDEDIDALQVRGIASF
ncbi:hypothetical protein ACG7TL_001622 [Trametes sanguinea]